ncbi:MAG: hypothetical protein ACJ8FY_09260 [Gemmataceae bacterium]
MTMLGAFSDRGALDVLPDHFEYRGKKSRVFISKVIAVSLVRQRFPWVTIVPTSMVLVPVMCFFANLGPAGLAACLPALGALIYFGWMSMSFKWVKVEYRHESNQTRKAYFRDGSWNGWALAGTIDLYHALEQHSHAEI